ncbi:MAG: carboxypeptidase-like regulatory domain-containing protein, partial [Rhodothermales bacterium]|nr:carboxypeptidase-like regulatory domain-containing protein [Rhodothermales bacterium]
MRLSSLPRRLLVALVGVLLLGLVPSFGGCDFEVVDDEGGLVDFSLRVRAVDPEADPEDALADLVPVVEAQAEFVPVGGEDPVETVVTDSEGNARFELSPGTYTVTVRADGYAPATVEVDTEQVQRVQVVLQTGQGGPVEATVTGKVESSEGEPIEGATLSFAPGEGTTLTAETGSDGTYTIEVPVGAYTVTVEAAGYAPFTGTLDVEGDTTYDVTLESQQGPANVQGRVVGSQTGSPVADVLVAFAPDGSGVPAESEWIFSLTTDADG